MAVLHISVTYQGTEGLDPPLVADVREAVLIATARALWKSNPDARRVEDPFVEVTGWVRGADDYRSPPRGGDAS